MHPFFFSLIPPTLSITKNVWMCASKLYLYKKICQMLFYKYRENHLYVYNAIQYTIIQCMWVEKATCKKWHSFAFKYFISKEFIANWSSFFNLVQKARFVFPLLVCKQFYKLNWATKVNGGTITAKQLNSEQVVINISILYYYIGGEF